MATGLFHTRSVDHIRGPARRRAFIKARGISVGQAARAAEQRAKSAVLRAMFAELIAEDMLLKDAAEQLGISKSYGIKLFKQIREELGIPVRD